MIHITVPTIPPSANELRRKYRNPFAYRRMRQQWEHALAYGVLCARHRRELIEQAKAGKRMRVEIAVYHRGTFDEDNMVAALKPILDGLKNVGYIQDDSAPFLDLVLPVKQWKSAEKKTVIKIGVANGN